MTTPAQPSKTPRTEAAGVYWNSLPKLATSAQVTYADFARQLETELATIDQCEDIVDRAIASENAALQARLDACVKALECVEKNIMTFSDPTVMPRAYFSPYEVELIRATLPSPESKEQRNKQ